MIKLLFRLLINAVAIWAAAYIVDGVNLDMNNLWAVAAVALVFGFFNAIVGPVVKFFSLPFIIFTLGIFSLVVNALLFWTTSALTDALSVSGFMPAFWGALIVSVVSWFLSMFLDDDDDDD